MSGWSPFEMNVGLACCGTAGAARPLFDVLGQGRADLCLASYFARLRRAVGCDLAAERHLYRITEVCSLVATVAASRLDEGRAADLVAFVMERGMNMQGVTA